MPRMVRKQIYLSTELNDKLRQSAARLQRSEAEVLREALAKHLDARPKPRAGVDEDPLWKIVGVGRSSDASLSERVDEYLYSGRKRRR